MEIAWVAPERNDKRNCGLDCCAGYVELFFLDRWRRWTVDGALRRKELHRLLGSLCFHKQSSKGRKKIFLNSLDKCVVSGITTIALSHLHNFVSHLLYVYLLFSVWGLLGKTLCTKTPFLGHLPFGLSEFQGEWGQIPCSSLATHQLLLFSEIPLSTFSYPTCNSLYKPFFPGKLPPSNLLPPLL